jgi:hypothetical protein
MLDLRCPIPRQATPLHRQTQTELAADLSVAFLVVLM